MPSETPVFLRHSCGCSNENPSVEYNLVLWRDVATSPYTETAQQPLFPVHDHFSLAAFSV
jgi:hypothetical protein